MLPSATLKKRALEETHLVATRESACVNPFTLLRLAYSMCSGCVGNRSRNVRCRGSAAHGYSLLAVDAGLRSDTGRCEDCFR